MMEVILIQEWHIHGKNRSIGPGETQKYSVIIGVGELNTPPTINVTSSFDKAYYPTQTVKSYRNC